MEAIQMPQALSRSLGIEMNPVYAVNLMVKCGVTCIRM